MKFFRIYFFCILRQWRVKDFPAVSHSPFLVSIEQKWSFLSGVHLDPSRKFFFFGGLVFYQSKWRKLLIAVYKVWEWKIWGSMKAYHWSKIYTFIYFLIQIKFILFCSFFVIYWFKNKYFYRQFSPRLSVLLFLNNLSSFIGILQKFVISDVKSLTEYWSYQGAILIYFNKYWFDLRHL